jgi:hypothetical protein
MFPKRDFFAQNIFLQDFCTVPVIGIYWIIEIIVPDSQHHSNLQTVTGTVHKSQIKKFYSIDPSSCLFVFLVSDDLTQTQELFYHLNTSVFMKKKMGAATFGIITVRKMTLVIMTQHYVSGEKWKNKKKAE